jgi:hypothetical protein
MWRHYIVILENSDITTRPWQRLAIIDNLLKLEDVSQSSLIRPSIRDYWETSSRFKKNNVNHLLFVKYAIFEMEIIAMSLTFVGIPIVNSLLSLF